MSKWLIAVVLMVVAVGLAACGGKDPEYITLTRAEMGEAWPFVDGIDEVQVFCEDNDAVVVRVDGVDYSANGTAKTLLGHPFLYEGGVQQAGMDAGSPALKACGVM